MAEISDESLEFSLKKSIKNIEDPQEISFSKDKLKTAFSEKLSVTMTGSNIMFNNLKISAKPISKDLFTKTSSSLGNFSKNWLYLKPAAPTIKNNLDVLKSGSGTIKLSDTMFLDPVSAEVFDNTMSLTNTIITSTNEALDLIEDGIDKTRKDISNWVESSTKLKSLGILTNSLFKSLFGDTYHETMKAYYASQFEFREGDRMRLSQKGPNGNPYDLDLKSQKDRSLGKNKAVAALLKNYMDISSEFSNMFDVFFVFENSDGGAPYPMTSNIGIDQVREGKASADALISKIISSRIEKINIPGDELSTFSQKFCGTSVQRIGTKHSFKNVAQLTLRADSGLFFVHLFNQLAGVDSSDYEAWKTMGDEGGKSVIKIKQTGEIPVFTNNKDKLNIYIKRTMSNEASFLWGEDNKKRWPQRTRNKDLKMESDLELQSLEDLTNATVSFLDEIHKSDLKDKSNSELKNNIPCSEQRFSFYIFTNCKFIGSGNPISFRRETCETLGMSYQFTFEKCLFSYGVSETDDDFNSDVSPLEGGRTLGDMDSIG